MYIETQRDPYGKEPVVIPAMSEGASTQDGRRKKQTTLLRSSEGESQSCVLPECRERRDVFDLPPSLPQWAAPIPNQAISVCQLTDRSTCRRGFDDLPCSIFSSLHSWNLRKTGYPPSSAE